MTPPPSTPPAENRLAIEDLIVRLTEASGPERELDAALWLTCVEKPASGDKYDRDMIGRWPTYTASIDAAMTLLPETAANLSLMDFIGHGNPLWGETAWTFRFMDTAQLMGERAAKEQIKRMKADYMPFGKTFRGPAQEVLERAIAQHYIEFYCLGAATAPLAICSAALRARQSGGVSS